MSADLPSPVMDLPRRDARDKLTGAARYTVDRIGAGMLHAAVLRAEGPAGRIVRLDLAPALALPGVRAVAGAADAPGLHGIGVADHPLFARDHVRHPGEALAAVAADTPEQARAALAAIVVEIAPDPAALTLDEALAPGARLVHPDWRAYASLAEGGNRRGNIAWEARVERGEVDAAFARADVRVVESVFEVGRQSHVPFEPRAAIARWEDGRVHIECSTQAPWTVRRVTAAVMGIAPSRVRVTVPPVGGGFGLKFDCTIEPIAAVLARKAGRPVALELDRAEEAATCLCRENARIRVRSAIDPAGAIAAREAEVLMDCGAYGGEQVFLTSMTAHTLGGNYRLGAVRLVSRAVYTNTPPNGAFRACNGVYCTFALERHTDEICARLGLDPLEFRRANVLGDGDLGATGQVFRGDVLGPMLERMEAASAPARRLEARAGLLPDGRLYGRASTVGTWFVFVGPSSATVHMHDDGSATLVTAGVEIGSGSMAQGLPQIVAAQLGIAPDRVVVRQADTDASGLDMGVGGGRTTVSLGAAGIEACAAVRAQLLEAAAEILQTPAEGLVLRDGRAEIAASPGAGVPIPELVARRQASHGPVAGHGAYTAPGEPALPGCAAGHFLEAIDIPVHAVHEAEVAVDPETGHVEVLAYRVVQDVGLALNPRAVRGQIQGGVAQGLGYALHEEVTLDPCGAIRQTGFESYRIPGALDVPAVEAILHEGAPSLGPLGIKGAGEVPILNVPAAVACAVSNAAGVAANALPLTPPRVLALLKGREG
ncbi:xanthine dehydrogenase family protein molybdopterin-binding subunit [Albimonas sp. CAU 1670]|uniref:xanthine dehydrogenase family protein molybdopterin-binding subunit n=1 Tax=Albimonas sp. CAU 1670 TaxID=3032599 RepID=UPI0023DA55C8|nr:xanthine dehydrogenase family protein molybdopterin-binding subunit [Albimonas sp. CAU 1670]MDF2230983.1 xanthine dehydrogenase family protein molybdopterin-binding subunit [Albimonas sp. CAU 1670]